MKKTKNKKHAPPQDSVRGYMREISVAIFLQIQTDIWIILIGYIFLGNAQVIHLN